MKLAARLARLTLTFAPSICPLTVSRNTDGLPVAIAASVGNREIYAAVASRWNSSRFRRILLPLTGSERAEISPVARATAAAPLRLPARLKPNGSAEAVPLRVHAMATK